MARYFIIGWWTVKRQFLMFIFVSLSPIFFFFSFLFISLFSFWSSLAVTVVTVKSNDHLSLSIKGGSELVEDERTQLSRAICSEINLQVSRSIASARRTWREEEKCFILFEFNRYDDTTFTLQLFSTSFSLHFVYTFHKKEGHTLRSSGIIDEMW